MAETKIQLVRRIQDERGVSLPDAIRIVNEMLEADPELARELEAERDRQRAEAERQEAARWAALSPEEREAEWR